jgi:hypothetical protein
MPDEPNQENTQPDVNSNTSSYKPPKVRSKKSIFITIGILIVLVIAAATAYLLNANLGTRGDAPSNQSETTQVTLKSQLEEAYKNSEKNTGEILFLTEPIVNDSANEGYKNARVGVANFEEKMTNSHFYQTPDETWHFFVITDNQGAIDCAEYNSEDLVNAFMGFTCWDNSQDASSFVEKDDPVFEIEPGAQGG